MKMYQKYLIIRIKWIFRIWIFQENSIIYDALCPFGHQYERQLVMVIMVEIKQCAALSCLLHGDMDQRIFKKLLTEKVTTITRWNLTFPHEYDSLYSRHFLFGHFYQNSIMQDCLTNVRQCMTMHDFYVSFSFLRMPLKIGWRYKK